MNAPSAHLVFDTETLRERDRFPALRDGLCRHLLAIEAVNHSAQHFSAHLDLQRVGAIDLAMISSSPADYVRNPELIRDGQDQLFVTLVHTGAMFCTQSDTGDRIAAAQAVVLDAGHIGGMHIVEDIRYQTMRVPRALIAPMLAPGCALAGRRLDRSAAAQRLLFSYLGEMRNVETRESAAASIFQQHIVDLVAVALGANDDTIELVKGRGIAAARLKAIKRDILDHLSDGALSLAALATRHRISPRYVGMLFERANESFSAYVLDQRLTLAHRMLNDWHYRDRKISAIAYDCGFEDVSYFNRTFRHRYGMTPSEMRGLATER